VLVSAVTRGASARISAHSGKAEGSAAQVVRRCPSWVAAVVKRPTAAAFAAATPLPRRSGLSPRVAVLSGRARKSSSERGARGHAVREAERGGEEPLPHVESRRAEGGTEVVDSEPAHEAFDRGEERESRRVERGPRERAADALESSHVPAVPLDRELPPRLDAERPPRQGHRVGPGRQDALARRGGRDDAAADEGGDEDRERARTGAGKSRRHGVDDGPAGGRAASFLV